MKVMYNAFKILLYPLLFVEIILLSVYKSCISPLMKGSCTYLPTCSSYTLRCILRFDAIYGLILGCKRLKRCNGHHEGGIDLEPLNILGDYKWIC